MLNKLAQTFKRIRGGAVEVSLRRYRRRLAEIEAHENDMRRFSDSRLQSIAHNLRSQLVTGQGDHLAESFALVREVASRVLKLRPYDEQILAGVALHQGKVVQMQTGEGKTLAAVPPAALDALGGRSVHILTFNDYLAHRDAEWMGPIFQFLGLTVGHVVQGSSARDRQAAYGCDVTYVTAKEAGFDFLRDQLTLQPEGLVHRRFQTAIIDEADSILIDEARVPLVIAGDDSEEPVNLGVLSDVVRDLTPGVDFEMDGRARNVHFTATGLDRLETELACGDLHDEQYLPVLTRLNQALHAANLLHRDVDYIVRDGQVLLLDELTGRVAENRRWPYGLQAAVEAKERQRMQPDGKIMNSITLQHFVGMYEKLSGMTGTAEAASEELHEFYGLRVVVVPTHSSCDRTDESDKLYSSRAAKTKALVREIGRLHERGQPVLVGTASVLESDRLATALNGAGIPCRVLNAKNDHDEATIIAQAGTYRTVTISTNMAGRGTDIRLGGPDEQDGHRIKSLGGLFVIGTNRHESRRIDNQLRGRSGRQGDPGRSRFIISLEDDLLARFGIADALRDIAVDDKSEQPLDDTRVANKVAHIQRVVEGECFEIRRTLRKYAAVLEAQRSAVAERRRALLLDESEASVLAERAQARYEDLAQRFGKETLHEVERQITLAQITRCWADHLAHIAEIRESIHLFSMGGLDPYYQYQKHAGEAFRDLMMRIDDEVVASFHVADISAAGIDLEREGLLGPSSTWTYMINDHPTGDVFERVTRGVKQMLKRM